MGTQKTVMNRSLAKALMEAGMEHFDVGGVVQAPNTGIGQTIQGGVSQGIQTVLSPLSGLTKGIAGAFTPQNEYQAQLAPTQTSNYTDVIDQSAGRAFQGYEDALKLRQQQQTLANILGQQVNGGGPNPAQLQLGQNTADTIAAQRALMASQRGAGANTGLIAKQAAQQGSAIQNRANADAALLQARQQLAAQDQLARQQATMAGQNLNEQEINARLLGIGAGAQNEQNLGGIRNYEMAQGINSKTAEENAKALRDTHKGLLSGIGSVFTDVGSKVPLIGGLFGAEGGKVPEHVRSIAKIRYPDHFKESAGEVPGHAEIKGNSVKNDKVPALLSPGEIVLPRSVTNAKDAPSKAAEFVKHLKSKKDVEVSKKDYKRIADKKKSLKERVERLEKMYGGGMS
jgi:hypothetical protein